MKTHHPVNVFRSLPGTCKKKLTDASAKKSLAPFKTILALIFLLISNAGISQVTIFSETFETATGAQNQLTGTAYIGWKNYSITSSQNTFWIFNSTRSAILTGTYSMAVSKSTPATSAPAQYNATTASNQVAFYGTMINASTYNTLRLNFKWRCSGESVGATNYDFGRVCYSTNGTTWTDFTNSGSYLNQASTTQTVANLDISQLNGTSFYLGFRWQNDNSTSYNPGFIVDDISVTGIATCTNPTTTYAITGGGGYCSGGAGVAVGLNGSQSGVTYQLYNGATPVGSTVAGTGAAISFGNQTGGGTYTVKSTAAGGYCAVAMTGSQVVTVNAYPPTVPPLTGGTSICTSGTGTSTTTLTAPALPTGGSISASGGYRYHKFTSGGTFTVPTGFAGNVEVLVIAGGGGGGGNGGGGGGAGGLTYNGAYAVTSGQAISVTVGTGGAAGNIGVNGANSIFGTITTTGGGGGAYRDAGVAGLNGGSGGGGSGASATPRNTPGTGVAGQGNSGGAGTAPDLGVNATGGGGGGAGGAGGAAVSVVGGAGGVGLQYAQFSAAGGSPAGWFAGGGGGGTTVNGTNGAGGNGGGGNGESTAGTANTGGGGGADRAGADGVVIIRYPDLSAGTWSTSDASMATVNSSGLVSGGSAAGAPVISYTVTNPSGGCTSAATATLTVTNCCVPPTSVAATASILTPCTGSTTTLQYSNLTGGSLGGGTWEYQWEQVTPGSAVLQAWSSTQNFTTGALATGNYTYVLKVRSTACSGSSTTSNTVSVNVNSCAAPVMSGFSPTYGCATTGTQITITGSNFVGASSVTVNGIAAAYVVNSSTSITAILPDGASGTGYITVTNPVSTVSSSTLPLQFTVNTIATPGTIQYGGTNKDLCAGSTFSSSNIISPTNGGSGALSVVWYCGEELSPGSGSYGNWIRSSDPAYSLYTAAGGASPATALSNYNPAADFPGKTKFMMIRRAYTDNCGECILNSVGAYLCQDQSFTVTILPLATQPSTITGPSVPCLGSSQTYSVTNVAGISYAWTFPSGWVQTGGGNTNSVTVTIGSGTGNVTVTPTQTNGCGTAAPRILAVTTSAPPTVTISAPNTSVCGGVGVLLTASGGSAYSWSPATGLSASTGAAVTATPTVNTTYTATETASGCSSSQSVLIRSGGTVTATAVATPTAVCSGAAVSLTATATVPSGGAATLYSENFEGMLNNVVLSSAQGGWIETPTNLDNDWGFSSTGAITGSRSLTLYYGSYNSYYTGASSNIIAYNTVKVNATNYNTLKLNFKWKGYGEYSGSTFYDYGTVVWSTNGTTWTDVSATKYNQQSTAQTVANLDLAAASGQQFYLGFRWINDGSGGSNPGFIIDDISITGISNPVAEPATFSWTSSPAGFTSTTQNPVANPTVGTTYTVVATSTNSGCTANSSTAPVTITPVPAQPSAFTGTGTSTSLCIGTSKVFTVTNVASVTYNWTFPSGWVQTAGTTTNSVTVTVGAGSGDITVTPSNSCGSGTPRILNVTPLTSPVVAVSPTSATYCNPGTAVGLTASGANTYAWSPSTGLSAATGASVNATPASTSTYTVTGTAVNGCIATATTVIISTSAPAAPVMNPVSATICPGTSQVIAASTYVPPAVTIYGENFEGTSTMVVSGTNNAAKWTVQPSPYCTATFGFCVGTNMNSGSKFASANCEGAFSSATANTQLTSPVLNLSGYTTLNLAFKHAYELSFTGEIAQVEVSLDGGTNWTSVQAYTSDQAIANFTAVNINLSAYVGNTNFKFRFNYVNADSYHWGVDDIVLSGNPVPAYSWTASPAGSSSGLSGANASSLTSNNSITVTPTASTTYTMTITLQSGCYAQSTSVITLGGPSAAAIASATGTTLTSGDFLWGGASSANWGTSSNWFQYDGSAFNTSGQTPAVSNRVFVLPGSTPGACISGTNNVSVDVPGTANNVFIGTGATMGINAGQTLEVYGNWTNNGTFNQNATGTVSMRGASAQTMTGSAPLGFTNLLVNKSGSSITLAQPVTVSGTLTMTAGNINSSAANLLTTGTSDVSPGSLSWTTGTVTGPLKRFYSGTANASEASGIFPVGNASKNRYARVNFTSNPGTGGFITAEYKPGICPVGSTGLPQMVNGQLVNNYEDEGYWDITPTGGNLNSTSYELILRGNTLSTVTSTPETRIIKSSGPAHTTWDNTGIGTEVGTVGGTTDFIIHNTGMTGFSWFNIGSDDINPLPVTLLNFSAGCENSMVAVKWTTASEQNSQKFVIEKSRDMNLWSFVAEREAAGSSNYQIGYLAEDADPFTGVSYYRLVQIDNNGLQKTFGPLSVSCGDVSNDMIVFPNPTAGTFTVEISCTETIDNAQIQLSDIAGKVISTRRMNLHQGNNQLLFEGADLQKGTYIVSLVSENGFKPVKVVVN